MNRWECCSVLLPLLSTVVFAQGTGRLTGSVIDPSGAAVPKAQINLLLHGGQKPLLSTQTTSEGLFSLESVRPELYDLVVNAQGFQTYKLENVKLDPARTTDLPAIKLILATATTAVDVQAGAETVQTSSPEISTTVSVDQIQRLPVGNRNPLAFISTQAGVASTQFQTVINGQRESFSTMTLDGISIQDNYLRDNDLDFSPNQLFLDQVKEFSVTTSLSGASSSGGSQVNFVTPSGTNEFHGNAYWQNRNNDLAADDFFDNKDGTGLPRLNLNNVGGSLGGPIKHDKVFFYVNYETQQLRNQALEDATILTASAEQGIFKYINSSGQVEQANILQLAGQQMNPVIQALINQLPSPSKINNYQVGDSHPGQLLNTAGYGYLVRNNQSLNNVTGRLDYNLSSTNSLSGTFAWNHVTVDRPDVAVSYSTTPPFQNDNSVKFGSLSWRWSPTAAFTNEVRAGLNFAPADFTTSEALPSSIIGGLYFSTPVAAASFLPQGRNTRTRDIQDTANWTWRRQSFKFGYQYQGVRIRSYDYAGVAPIYDVADPGCGCVDSAGQQQSLLTSNQLPGIKPSDLTNANVLLASLAGLLDDDNATYNVTGRTSGFVPGIPWVRNFTYDNHAFFAEDQWKMLKRLTLTLGLRWDYYSPVNEANALELQPVVMNNNPASSLLDPNATLNFTGNSVGVPFYQKNLNNWAPNGGIAWDVFGDGNTSLRAGYALKYVDDQMIEVADGFTYYNPGLQAYPANYDLTGKITSTPPMIPVPAFQVPTSFGTQYALNPATTFALIDPHLKTPYDQQFALSIEHKFKGMIVEARFVGDHATRLLRGFDVNQENVTNNGFLSDFIKAQANGTLSLKQTGTFNPAFSARLPGSQPLLVFNQLSGKGDLTDPTFRTLIQNGEVGELAYQYTLQGLNGNLNFFPNANALSTLYLTNFSNSTYDSGQIEVRRRLQNGMHFQVNYVFSKWLSDGAGVDPLRVEPFLDINNAALERSRTPNDLTNQFKANYSYDLPIGEGHLLRLKGGWNRLLQGWTTSGNLSWVSGNPYSVESQLGTFLREDLSGNNTADTALNKSQLDSILQLQMTPNGPYMVPASAIGPDGRGVATVGQPNFTGQIFTNPAAGALGTLQRRMFTGPSVFDMDAALFKDTKVNERISFELRAEALNVFNHVAFAVFDGNMNINSPQFGQVTSLAISPRQIQLGLRVKF